MHVESLNNYHTAQCSINAFVNNFQVIPQIHLLSCPGLSSLMTLTFCPIIPSICMMSNSNSEAMDTPSSGKYQATQCLLEELLVIHSSKKMFWIFSFLSLRLATCLVILLTSLSQMTENGSCIFSSWKNHKKGRTIIFQIVSGIWPRDPARHYQIYPEWWLQSTHFTIFLKMP